MSAGFAWPLFSADQLLLVAEIQETEKPCNRGGETWKDSGVALQANVFIMDVMLDEPAKGNPSNLHQPSSQLVQMQ